MKRAGRGTVVGHTRQARRRDRSQLHAGCVSRVTVDDSFDDVREDRGGTPAYRGGEAAILKGSNPVDGVVRPLPGDDDENSQPHCGGLESEISSGVRCVGDTETNKRKG